MPLRIHSLSFVLAFLSAISLRAADPAAIALVGGTVIDVSHFGTSQLDLAGAVVLIRGDRIAAVGRDGSIDIPADADRIDASGKFIVPGLIDGFAVLNNQSYANAYLYMGVTAIIGVGDKNWRRGPMHYDAKPSPHIYRFASIGYQPEGSPATAPAATTKEFGSADEYVAELERLHREGVCVVLLHYHLEPEHIRALVARSRELGMATIGELAYTSYAQAIELGVDAFVHTQRYSLDIAPPEVRRAVGGAPFSRDAPGLRAYLELISALEPDDPQLLAHARRLGSGRSGLITTLAMSYPDLPGAKNPWKLPIATILDPADIHEPCDRETGARPPMFRNVTPDSAAQILMIEQSYCRAGAKYLAGSGTDAFGTMPGISLHQELELLVRAGLTPRQALAAATWNYSEIFRWHETGEIKPGARADVLVLDADPRTSVENLQKIRDLILDGQRFDRARLLERNNPVR